MLELQDLEILRKEFSPQQHEFLNGNAYITESAITTRIEDVDPSWTLERIDIFTRGEQVIVTMRMTIKGVSRDGVGMCKITTKQTRNNQGDVTAEYEVNEAEKAAATDAMKRAARLFGVGRYLLDLPSNVKDMASLVKHMGGGSQPAQPTPQTQKPVVKKTATGAKVETPLGAGENRRLPVEDKTAEAKPLPYHRDTTWVVDLDALLKGKGITLNYKHRENLIGKLLKEGTITKESTMEELVDVIVAHENAKLPLDLAG